MVVGAYSVSHLPTLCAMLLASVIPHLCHFCDALLMASLMEPCLALFAAFICRLSISTNMTTPSCMVFSVLLVQYNIHVGCQKSCCLSNT